MTDVIGSIGNVVSTLSNNSFFGKLAITAGALTTAYFTPIAGLLFACFACTTVDLIYGLKVAKRAGKKLESRKSWKGTLTKIRDEFTIIMLSHLLEHVIGATTLTVLSGGATILICLTELWSILENLNTLDPEGPWKVLGKYLRRKGSDLAGINISLTNDGNLDIETTGDNVSVVKES